MKTLWIIPLLCLVGSTAFADYPGESKKGPTPEERIATLEAKVQALERYQATLLIPFFGDGKPKPADTRPALKQHEYLATFLAALPQIDRHTFKPDEQQSKLFKKWARGIGDKRKLDHWSFVFGESIEDNGYVRGEMLCDGKAVFCCCHMKRGIDWTWFDKFKKGKRLQIEEGTLGKPQDAMGEGVYINDCRFSDPNPELAKDHR